MSTVHDLAVLSLCSESGSGRAWQPLAHYNCYIHTCFNYSCYLFSNIAMPQIKWGNCHMNTNHSVCLVTIDGTDFHLQEPTVFNPRWFSHKFKGPGLCYEVGVCIQTGWIVWINGPYAPGDWSNLAIACYGIAGKLDPGKKHLADGGYSSQDGNAETPTGLHNHDQCMKVRARIQHKAINGLLKQYGILRDCFHHSQNDHALIFKTVANLVQAKSCLKVPCIK